MPFCNAKSYRTAAGFLVLAGLLFSLLLSACAPATTQVISGDPRSYLMNTSELPDGQYYFVPEGDAFLIPNEAAVSEFGKEKAEQLIQETERVTAGRVHYQISDPSIAAPQVYLATVVIHQSAEAAQKAVEQYNIAALYPEGGWQVEKDALKIGDRTIVETGETQDSSGRRAVSIRVEFSYRNVSADVMIFGLNDTVTLGKAEQAARAVLVKLQTAELTNGPVPTLTPSADQ